MESIVEKSTDNRNAERAALLIEVKYEGAGVRAYTRISDISETGIFVDSISPLPVGASLKLTFTLPNGHVVEVEGRVAQCQPGIGMGIEFSSLKPGDAAAISEVVHQ
jgi:PilZ domain